MKTTTETTEKQTAIFTKFNKGDNWVKGTIGKYNFEAKLFDMGSIHGINEGRVSKLCIADISKGWDKGCIVSYDRGWDIEPKDNNRNIFESVMQLLENSPKLF